LLPVDLVTARAHAQVWAELAAAGLMICGWRPPVWPTVSPWSPPMSANLRGFQDCRLRCGAGLAKGCLAAPNARPGADAETRAAHT
jgi:hypothetical protein